MFRRMILLLIVLMLSLASTPAVAGMAYPDPPGGWTYIHSGAAADSATGWDHDNGSDEWDGSAIGAGKAGGVSHLTDDGTYVRIQDCFPRNPGDDPSNRKIMFTRDIVNQDGVAQATADQILSVEGVTLSFRARIATTGLLDLYDGSSAWPAGGDGYGTHDGGKDNFTIHQDAGGDQCIGFSLALATEQPSTINDYTGGRACLIMNALNGTTPSADVDAHGNEGTGKNILELADPTQWHEFWITIQPDTSGGGTHLVTIWKDGSMTPDEFHITAGNGGDEGYSYISMGCGSTDQAGAIDAERGLAAPEIRHADEALGRRDEVEDAGVERAEMRPRHMVALVGHRERTILARDADAGAQWQPRDRRQLDRRPRESQCRQRRHLVRRRRQLFCQRALRQPADITVAAKLAPGPAPGLVKHPEYLAIERFADPHGLPVRCVVKAGDRRIDLLIPPFNIMRGAHLAAQSLIGQISPIGMTARIGRAAHWPASLQRFKMVSASRSR